MMDWLKTLTTYAPAIAGAIATGGTGPLIAVALKTVADHFGVEPTEQAVAQAVQKASPEDLLKLKQLDLEFARLDLDRERAYLGDTDSARKMQTAALEQADLFSKRFVYYFITGWSCFCAVYIFWITFGAIPVANQRFADTILGFLLGTALAGCFSYLLGTSLGSVRSSQTLRDLARNSAAKS